MFSKLSLRTALVVVCLCAYLAVAMAWGGIIGDAIERTRESVRSADPATTIDCSVRWASTYACIQNGGGQACLATVPRSDACYQWLQRSI